MRRCFREHWAELKYWLPKNPDFRMHRCARLDRRRKYLCGFLPEDPAVR